MAETTTISARRTSRTTPDIDALLKAIKARQAKIAVIGLGYVGIPLALTGAKAGFSIIGFDIDVPRVAQINRGESFIKHITSQAIAEAVKSGRFEATSDFGRLSEPDAILICVPTPLTKYREPDLTYVVDTAKTIAPRLRPGQLIVLESTTYPGTTTEVLKPIFEARGLRSGVDFFLAFSPEREDPGNPDFATASIPKVVGGDGEDALRIADALYGELVVRTVPVSSPATAEAVKLTENIFRSVNIALVNELKIVYGAMGVDVWEVIDAAKTKPFGFMPFYPGPGLGGHCIPIDPFYLTWKAREYDLTTRFIELAGEINTAMPRYVVDRLAEAMDRKLKRGLNGSKVLVLGIAYKKNVDDMRESPSLKLIELLEERGAKVEYHDPFIPVIPRTREHAALAGRKSAPLDAKSIAAFDSVLIATDHDGVDYAGLAEHAKLIVDTRNACTRAGLTGANIVKA
ncbi:MAG: nucleotide sugar dehydrogenase [Hyphomicrobiales bacterium]